MSWSRLFAVGAVAALLAVGCSSDPAAVDAPAEDPAVADGAAADDAADEEVADAPAEDEPVAAAGGDVVATLTLDGQTYEATEILDCTVNDPIAPDDRLFVGRNADGTVQIAISYFSEEQFAGLTGVSLDLTGPDGDVTWATSYAGADAAFTITPRADGADGTAEIRSLGIGIESETLVAEWSFIC